jgi:hypothetical protein
MNYKLLTTVMMAIIAFSGCVENKRKPEKIVKNSRQLAKIYGDSLAYQKIDLLTTVYITDSSNTTLTVEVTRKMMENIIKLLQMAIDFNYTDRMDEILRLENLDAAEHALMKEMDKIAHECEFESFSQAGKIIDKLKDYPEISALLNKLSEIEKIKYK